MTESLSTTLRELSRVGHEPPSEPAPEPNYHTAFLRGGLNREGVAAQFAQHFLIYEALEDATRAQKERLGDAFTFYLPELFRVPALEADLRHWIGDNWESVVRERYTTEGIREYVERIREVCFTSLPCFVAHHYTRYLADLSGGFMIGKMFREHYGTAGSAFYSFPEIDDPKAYKDGYRELLDALELTDAEREELLAEVKLAYRLNNRAGHDLFERFEAEYQA